jgi:hypothetical protein|tara:strand:- start:8782 stop:9048 length:267 start_codon:yes stop_codon:yes gene_type:complete
MKTFYNNNYGVSIINNEFTRGVELAVLLGNESMYIIVHEEVYDGLDDKDVDNIIIDVSSRKTLSDAEVAVIIEDDRKEMERYNNGEYN